MNCETSAFKMARFNNVQCLASSRRSVVRHFNDTFAAMMECFMTATNRQAATPGINFVLCAYNSRLQQTDIINPRNVSIFFIKSLFIYLFIFILSVFFFFSVKRKNLCIVDSNTFKITVAGICFWLFD